MSGTRVLQGSAPPFAGPAGAGIAEIKFAKGDTLFAQGEPADAVFYIRDGKVRIGVLSRQGKEAVIAILEAGQFCGEASLGQLNRRSATAQAITDGTAVRIDKSAVLPLMHSDATFARTFTEHLVARNIRVEADLVDQMFNPSEKRLARLLLILANFGESDGAAQIAPTISHETLAEMIGTTRPRVSYFMNKFRNKGYIDYDGHLTVYRTLHEVVLGDGEL